MAFGRKKKNAVPGDDILDLNDEEFIQETNDEADDADLLYIDTDNGEASSGTKKDKKRKKDKKKEKKDKPKLTWQQMFARICTGIAIIVSMYCTCVFSNFSFIKYWRTIYIETAMSTMTHQWLATAFIPGWIIDDVMNDVTASMDKQEKMESSWSTVYTDTQKPETAVSETVEISEEEQFYSAFWELDSDDMRRFLQENPEYTADGYGNIYIEDLKGKLGLTTTEGDPLLVLDTYNNLMIIKVTGKNFQGKMAIVKNAKQVDLAMSKKYGNFGESASSYAERLGALIVVNANRFSDPDGHGTGATIKGSYVVNGEEIGHVVGTKENGWKFCGFKSDYKFYISNLSSVDKSEYIWGMECVPALIVNGESAVDGSFGMGIQPRTAVGQTASGDFMMLVIDGRQPGWSIGCTVANCAEIMLKYRCYQAMNMDGGSSSVMYYKTKQITKSSSASGEGRYTPNAFVIMPSDWAADK